MIKFRTGVETLEFSKDMPYWNLWIFGGQAYSYDSVVMAANGEFIKFHKINTSSDCLYFKVVSDELF